MNSCLHRGVNRKFIPYDCSNISGFFKVTFGFLGEATKQTTENNGHVLKTMVYRHAELCAAFIKDLRSVLKGFVIKQCYRIANDKDRYDQFIPFTFYIQVEMLRALW